MSYRKAILKKVAFFIGVPLDKTIESFAKLTPKEREGEIVSLCGRIWARAMKEKILKEKPNSS